NCLRFELFLGQSIAGVAFGVVDAGGQRSAVRRRDLALANPPARIKTVDLLVELHANLGAESGNTFVAQGITLERFEIRRPVSCNDPQHASHGELRLMDSLRIDNWTQD